MPFEWLKLTHICCAFLSISGFTLRGWWLATANPRLRSRPAKIFPHLIDTLLLGSALAMLFQWQLNPFQVNWLVAKICALLLYICLGMVAFRFGRTRAIRLTAFALALATVGYIVSVAYSKSALGVLVLLAASTRGIA
jgi:uncharacterized membrane protein SirB2